MKSEKSAFCEINVHGRLLAANQKFCSLFGYKAQEVEWHYIRDIFRYSKDWTAFIHKATSKAAHYIVRLKNRKGRSFMASISRDAIEINGKIVYRNTFQKIKDSAEHPAKDCSLTEQELYEPQASIAL